MDNSAVSVDNPRYLGISHRRPGSLPPSRGERALFLPTTPIGWVPTHARTTSGDLTAVRPSPTAPPERFHMVVCFHKPSHRLIPFLHTLSTPPSPSAQIFYAPRRAKRTRRPRRLVLRAAFPLIPSPYCYGYPTYNKPRAIQKVYGYGTDTETASRNLHLTIARSAPAPPAPFASSAWADRRNSPGG